MSTDTDSLSGSIGQPAHFYGDYLFRSAALPNAGTITSDEYTMNNTLGALKLRGYIDSTLETGTGNLSIELQYKDTSGAWRTYTQLVTATNKTLGDSDLFEVMPVPNTEKRIFRLAITTDFDASGVNITCPIELIPRA